MRTPNPKTPPVVAQPPLGGSQLKYQQVKTHVLQQIAEGHLKPGDALPPERALAEMLGLAVHTVRHALGDLSQENIVHRVQGKGTFVNEKPPNEQSPKLDIFALVVPEVVGALYPSLIKGFMEATSDTQHQVLVCNTHMDTHVQGDMILQLINQKMSGVAIIPTLSSMPAYQLDMLRSHGIPVVFCHRRPPGSVAPLITWPWKEVGRRAGEVMLGRGHRRFGFVASAPRYVVSSGYLEGLQEILAENGLDLPDDRISYHQVDDQNAAKMLEASDRPTAVFCSDTEEAEFIYMEAMRLGLRVPEDLSIVGFGCVWRDGVLSQRLAVVTIDERELGRQAALLLGEMRNGRQPMINDECIVVPLGFSEGQSLGSAPPE